VLEPKTLVGFAVMISLTVAANLMLIHFRAVCRCRYRCRLDPGRTDLTGALARDRLYLLRDLVGRTNGTRLEVPVRCGRTLAINMLNKASSYLSGSVPPRSPITSSGFAPDHPHPPAPDPRLLSGVREAQRRSDRSQPDRPAARLVERRNAWVLENWRLALRCDRLGLINQS